MIPPKYNEAGPTRTPPNRLFNSVRFLEVCLLLIPGVYAFRGADTDAGLLKVEQHHDE